MEEGLGKPWAPDLSKLAWLQIAVPLGRFQVVRSPTRGSRIIPDRILLADKIVPDPIFARHEQERNTRQKAKKTHKPIPAGFDEVLDAIAKSGYKSKKKLKAKKK
ncbi:MAG: hypothetical protein WAZ27_00950 [Minisyncoccia bacterium]